ncbi:MAG: alpha-amylase family glycosyl hydrolase [Termitinemataceae bacterium]|nr:MAG: alpha-amylase family glycosyl hydrolase [Termitinemataceae bacterium]
MPKWLNDAVFYEIYPQSFYDSNGDGIGDINGIIQKLDYVHSIGCNALWINPCFDSPFKDAGYDVRDYKKVAPRYGTNEDLKNLFREAHKRGIHVLLDLVPGHTSEEHEWFVQSKQVKENSYSNRYIWTDHWIRGADNLRYVAGEAPRNATYIINFFKCQPALNYGILHPSESWQLPIDHPDSVATREAIKDVIRFWLDAGADGFRVDMADSLVKLDDDQKSGTARIWRNIRDMLDADYPEAALVSEWSNPELSLKAGFHADFLLDHEGHGYKTLVRDYKLDPKGCFFGDDHSYFRKDGGGDITRFLDEYMRYYNSTKNDGYISIITGNHDTRRLRFTLSDTELALVYAVFFTFPGVPFLYYGDEIGMHYQNLPTKEGGYDRTGTRTPMQWSHEKNCGFSTADSAVLYLPVDTSPDAPTVEAQEKESASLLNTVKAILKLRHSENDLQALPNIEIIAAEKDKPFVYRRGSFVLAVNPSGAAASAAVPALKDGAPLVYAIGECSAGASECRMGAQSFGVWRV